VPVVQDPAWITDPGSESRAVDAECAAWRKQGDVLLLVANLAGRERDLGVHPSATLLRSVGRGALQVRIAGNPAALVPAGRLAEALARVRVPAREFVLVHLRRPQRTKP
jgi:hypothetical protein